MPTLKELGRNIVGDQDLGSPDAAQCLVANWIGSEAFLKTIGVVKP